ncbi:MAG TPA: hypothetical protein VK966_10070, partial [Longimicrobiales bacterium]|nr:hypothetical protein [Longimicrobiales bacterium]
MAQNPAPAGQPPMVAAGGVATLAVRKELVSDSLAFQVAPGPDARLFSAPRGWIRGDEGVGRLVVTLGVPATAIAGPVVLGTVTFGDGDVQTLEARVQTRRSAELLLDGDALTVPAGHGVAIGYRVRNLGNAPDTFSVALSAPSSWSADQRTTLIVPAGADSAGTFRFRLPRNARRGTEHQLRLTLVGTDIQSARSTRVIVVAEESRIGNLVTVPGSVFLGTSTGGSGTDGATPGVALTAGGEIRPGTTVRLAARHLETLTPAPAFRGMLAGPRLQLSIDAPDWNATLGDLYPSSELVPGHLTHGRGAEGAFRSGALSVRAT